MQYQGIRNAYNNQEKVIFEGVGEFGIPPLRPVDFELGSSQLVRIDKAIKCPHPEDKVLHFFTHDYVFEKVWKLPDRYIEVFGRFRAIIAPDFSLYVDYPKAAQIWSHFKKHWLGAYYSQSGITVIPCIRWLEGDPGGFDWCLDGEPLHSTICVSTLGGIKGQWRKDDFLQSLQRAVDVLVPSRIIIVGDFFPGLYDLRYDGPIEYAANDCLDAQRGEVASMGMGRSNARGGSRDDINWEDHAPKGFSLFNNEGAAEKAMTVDKWEKNLTDNEEKAIYAYTSQKDGITGQELWEVINDAASGRSNDARGKRYAEDLGTALDKYYLKQNTVVHGVYDANELFGGATTMAEIRKLYGQTVSYDGYMSSSSVPNSDKYPGTPNKVAIHAKVPQGRGIGAYIGHHTDYAWEQEFLFNKNPHFRVEGAWMEWNGLLHVNLTYIGRG